MFLVVRVVDEDFLSSLPTVAFGIGKLRLDIDRAAFDRVETNVDVVVLECLGDLVLGVHEEEVL